MSERAAGSGTGGSTSRRRAQAASAGFERLRPRPVRIPAAGPEIASGAIGRDTDGKRALYSGERPAAPRGAGLSVRCSRCGQHSAIGARRALRLLTPSVHLPVPRVRHPSLVRCPACRRVSWVRLSLRISGF